jgi:hypothetical protein
LLFLVFHCKDIIANFGFYVNLNKYFKGILV